MLGKAVDDKTEFDETSHHYFIDKNRKYRKLWSSRSDLRQHATMVHRALVAVAEKDWDHAHFANGAGFSRSDGRAGHWYARMDEAVFISIDTFVAQSEHLAYRYRKQLPTELREYFDPAIRKKQRQRQMEMKL